jgi:hypothetical protein
MDAALPAVTWRSAGKTWLTNYSLSAGAAALSATALFGGLLTLRAFVARVDVTLTPLLRRVLLEGAVSLHSFHRCAPDGVKIDVETGRWCVVSNAWFARQRTPAK